MGFEGFPFILGWELTLGCNLTCRHCGSSAGRPRDRELSTEEALEICDQLPPLLVQEVNFTGGEALLRDDWSRIVSRLNDLGIKAKILTNGLILNTNTIDIMKEVGIAGVGVSLDGLEETHESIRGRQNLYNRVVLGIQLVLGAGVPVTVITTVNARNIHELPAMLDFLGSLGVSRWQIQPTFPLGRAPSYSDLQVNEMIFLKLGEFIMGWEPRAREIGVELLPGDSFGYYTDLDIRQPPWLGCPAGLFSCGITSDGKVKGCLSLPDELVEGDLRVNDLWDIWFHPSSFAYNRQFSTDDLGSFCQSCNRAEECRGGCSAMSYGSTGRFHNDPFCFLRIGAT